MLVSTRNMNIKPIFNLNESIDQTNYYSFDVAFSEEQLGWISNLVERYPFEKATTISSKSEDVDIIRKSNIKWIHHDNLSYWVYDRILNRTWVDGRKLRKVVLGFRSRPAF